jgi:hypothetical protein
VRPTYQAIERPPIQIVATLGVRFFGWISPKVAGIALTLAIDSAVRAVGRIVVWVDAAADVSTAMITILSHGLPKTWLPSSCRTSSSSASCFGPPNAIAAVATIT